MNTIVWIGVLITLVGLGVLMSCIFKVWDAKRKGATGEELTAVLQSVVPINLAAMGLSGLGLMTVVVGLVFFA